MVSEEEFRQAVPEYDDGNIVILGEVAMYGDEEALIKQTIREVHKRFPFKKVIECGFGFGFTADAIQEFKPEEHIIIEANKHIFKKALEWSEGKKGVKIIFDRWQNLPVMETEFLYFDTYEMVSDELPDIQNLKYKYFSGVATPNPTGIEKEGWFTFEFEGENYIMPMTERWKE